MEATVAVRHIGEVVIDVFSGARDADGDAVVGQKSGAGDEMPLGADRRSDRRVRQDGSSDIGVGTGRSYRLIGPALWSMLRGGLRLDGLSLV